MKLRKKLLIITGTIIVILSLLVIPTYARYIYNAIKDMYLASKSFYFNSDKLTTSNDIYQVNNWSAIDTFTIPISLNNGKNDLLRANSDISYEISYTCSDNINCSVNSTGGTLYSSERADSFNATLSPKPDIIYNNGDQAWIELIVNSISPYKKTLKGRFYLNVGTSDVYYSIEDETKRSYLNCKITNTLDYYLVKEAFGEYSVNDRIDRNTYNGLSDIDKEKCNSALITLKFNPNVVVLDMTNSAYLNAEEYTTKEINGYKYVNSITFKMDSETSVDVKFYKAETQNDYTFPIVNNTSIINFQYTV